MIVDLIHEMDCGVQPSQRVHDWAKRDVKDLHKWKMLPNSEGGRSRAEGTHMWSAFGYRGVFHLLLGVNIGLECWIWN